MPVWPVSLPALSVVNEYTEEPADRSLRSEMDEGPDKVRKLTNAQPDILKFSQILTIAQVEILDVFYKTTTDGGTIVITDTHPRTGSSVNLRFAGPPSYQHIGGAWKASIELEVLP